MSCRHRYNAAATMAVYVDCSNDDEDSHVVVAAACGGVGVDHEVKILEACCAAAVVAAAADYHYTLADLEIAA